HRRAGGRPRRRAGRSRCAARARRRLRRPVPPAGPRGRAGGHLTGDDEQQIGKAYDGRLISRLWTFVHPYRSVAWLTGVLAAIQQILSLAQPYLLKIGIDRYVGPRNLAGLSRLALW